MVMWIQTEAGEWHGALILSMSASSNLSSWVPANWACGSVNKNIDSLARGAGSASGLRVVTGQAAQQLLNAARGLAPYQLPQESPDWLLCLMICGQFGKGTIHFVQQMGEKCLIVDGKRIERDADRPPVTRAVKQRRIASLKRSGV
jgi:hypothetical protein